MDRKSVLLTRYAGKSIRSVWFGAILLAALSVWSMVHYGFNSNLLNLIPKDASRTRLYLNLVRDFGVMDETFIILDGDIAGNKKAIEEFAADLAKNQKLIRGVSYRLDPAVLKFLSSLFRKNALLYLDRTELREALGRLQPGEMERQLLKIKSRLVLPSSVLALNDPLGFSEFMISHMPSLGTPVDTASGYYLAENGTRLFMIVKPAGDARDIRYDRELIGFINAAYRKHFGPGSPVKMGLTGNHPITYYEQEIMKRDIAWNIVSSFIAVSLIFIVFLRTMRGMFYGFLPVLLSIAVTAGIAVNIFGTMSEVSGAFGAMLVGLGIDLPIVLYIRFLLDNDIERSVSDTSGAIWAGVMTTAATFYPMVISDFRGIRELGFLTATGIIICGIFVFSLSAPLMRKGKKPEPVHTGLEALPVYVLRYKKAFIAFCILISALSVYGIRGIGFKADLQGLGAKKNPARQLINEVDMKGDSAFITGTAPTKEGVITASADIMERLEKEGISGAVSLASFVPDHARQDGNLEIIRKVNIDKAVRSFRLLARKNGFSGDRIDLMSERLREFLEVDRPVSLDDFAGTGMEDILGRFYRHEGTGYRFLVITKYSKRLKEILKGYDITGPEVVREELSSLLKRSAILLSLIAILLVNVTLYLKFRNFLLMLYAQLPVLLAILVTGAVLNRLGISIHIMNAIVAVMLFGIGTDYSIHMIHRIQHGTDIKTLTRGTGRAISLAAYTTIAGFGSIYFSSYQGLSEMGIAVTLGCLLSLVFALVLVPILMHGKIRS